jgi:hypothetical protein
MTGIGRAPPAIHEDGVTHKSSGYDAALGFAVTARVATPRPSGPEVIRAGMGG